ncbi:MAG TPA: ABC transporter permease subunit [Tepidiformaceae bacterium]|nr:ABC transporter permease subunit [Tepidiformaceae bacterium]
MTDALRAELFKVLRRRMTYICLLVAMGLVLLFYIILWLRVRQGPDHGFRGYAEWLNLRAGLSFHNVVPYGFALERFFVTLMAVIFAGTMAGNEYDWRTVGVVVGRGVQRPQFLAAKFVSGIVFTFVAVTLAFLVALAASAWFTNLYGLDYGTIDGPWFGHILASIVRTGFVVLPFVLMAIFFATFLRSAGQAVGAALGFYFIEGIFTGLLTSAHGWLSHVPEALFNLNGDAIIRLNGIVPGNDAGLFSTTTGIPAWRGFVVLAIWLVAFLIVGFWRFQTRDIQE